MPIAPALYGGEQVRRLTRCLRQPDFELAEYPAKQFLMIRPALPGRTRPPKIIQGDSGPHRSREHTQFHPFAVSHPSQANAREPDADEGRPMQSHVMLSLPERGRKRSQQPPALAAGDPLKEMRHHLHTRRCRCQENLHSGFLAKQAGRAGTKSIRGDSRNRPREAKNGAGRPGEELPGPKKPLCDPAQPHSPPSGEPGWRRTSIRSRFCRLGDSLPALCREHQRAPSGRTLRCSARALPPG